MEGSPRGEGPSDRLCRAAARGDREEVRRLLEAGVDPNGTNSFGRTPLQLSFFPPCLFRPLQKYLLLVRLQSGDDAGQPPRGRAAAAARGRSQPPRPPHRLPPGARCGPHRLPGDAGCPAPGRGSSRPARRPWPPPPRRGGGGPARAGGPVPAAAAAPPRRPFTGSRAARGG
ncbi:tumor suppressor ARF-like isoform X1 [Heliangelus exortis]|uniref:tumor suppressor ARF-like isoform X1 n=1 Tax=Heliangelus exortis TaxID=472823 RepID=UPI003A95D84A